MTVPRTHTQERLNLAYISIVAAMAGYALSIPDGPEYGIDGTLRQVVQLPNGMYNETGYSLNFQAKATITGKISGGDFVYDLSAKAYNKLASMQGPTPCILIVMRLPRDDTQWVALDEEKLLLRHTCYWSKTNQFEETSKKSSIRIRIPRTQILTPQAIQQLFGEIREGRF